MRKRWLVRLTFMLTVAVIIVSVGCNAFSEERQRRRSVSIWTDLDHMVDDVDWALGLDQPSSLYEETFPPYPR